MGRQNWGDSRTDRQFISAFTKFINEIKAIGSPYLARPHPHPDYWAYLTMLMIMERQSGQLKLESRELQAFAAYMMSIAASLLIERGFSDDEVYETLQIDDEDLRKLRRLVEKHRGK